ncbi:MAG TPA: SDR family NAD(P)-dependent oxidoreductase [Actinomycetes bacterium]|nr:SDR family NAD(P)-dependent oxidoreductase [Actinomycetes bacterium]
MEGRTILITGATGGIGNATALELARQGARVVVTGRDRDRGEAAVAALRERSGNRDVALLLADLSTQAGARGLAAQFMDRHARLDVLVNNAGLADSKRRLTADGIEADLAVNALAPFLLTRLLLAPLRTGPSARVVNLAGGVPGEIHLDNLQAERSFHGLESYSHSKTIQMALSYELAQRLRGSGVTVNVCYPGRASTAMTRSVTRDMFPGWSRLLWPLFRRMTRPDQGRSAARAARSSIYLATSPDLDGVTGQYVDSRCRRADWPAAVLDPHLRARIWAVAEQLTHTAAQGG